MARPRTASIQVETTSRILAAAEAAFARSGFAGARLADIAAAAGIKRPSLLYHFKTKDDLYEAVLETAFSALVSALRDGLDAPGTYDERLDATTSALIAFEATRPYLGHVVLRALLEPDGAVRDRMAARLAPVFDITAAFVATEGPARRRPDVPPRAAIATLFLGHLLRSTLGATGVQLFGPDDATPVLTRALLGAGSEVSR